MRKRSTPLLIVYVLSVLAALALLIVWVVYVVRSSAVIGEVVSLPGARGGVHWGVLVVTCLLASLLIVGLTYQLAQALAARRYSAKQEEFVSNITHEMKSPLAGIKLHAQTLALAQEGGELSEAQRRRSVSLILQEAERMAVLVDNVLESSRLLARKKDLELEPVELAGFFPGYFEKMVPRLETHGVTLRVLGETRAVVRGTDDALDRVMTNLLENAARFSERGGEVRCRLTDSRDQVRIEVEDDGLGIPKKELSKVFDRFYQIGREISGRRKGTGLGLFIVSGLVGQMNGTIQALSQEGRPGARFVIDLPRADRKAA